MKILAWMVFVPILLPGIGGTSFKTTPGFKSESVPYEDTTTDEDISSLDYSDGSYDGDITCKLDRNRLTDRMKKTIYIRIPVLKYPVYCLYHPTKTLLGKMDDAKIEWRKKPEANGSLLIRRLLRAERILVSNRCKSSADKYTLMDMEDMILFLVAEYQSMLRKTCLNRYDHYMKEHKNDLKKASMAFKSYLKKYNEGKIFKNICRVGLDPEFIRLINFSTKLSESCRMRMSMVSYPKALEKALYSLPKWGKIMTQIAEDINMGTSARIRVDRFKMIYLILEKGTDKDFLKFNSIEKLVDMLIKIEGIINDIMADIITKSLFDT